jgi:hypothetical protein
MDFVTGLPPSRSIGVTNYIVITNQLTKTIIRIRIDSTIAEDVAEVLLMYFYIHHRILLAITSDRGP